MTNLADEFGQFLDRFWVNTLDGYDLIERLEAALLEKVGEEETEKFLEDMSDHMEALEVVLDKPDMPVAAKRMVIQEQIFKTVGVLRDKLEIPVQDRDWQKV